MKMFNIVKQTARELETRHYFCKRTCLHIKKCIVWIPSIICRKRKEKKNNKLIAQFQNQLTINLHGHKN